VFLKKYKTHNFRGVINIIPSA